MKTAFSIALAAFALSSSARADDVEPNDPMLVPIAPAPDAIRSWDDALARIRRAPDLLASISEVDRAAGQRRIVLAGVLPSVIAVGQYQHTFDTQVIPLGPTALTVPSPNVWSIAGVASWTLDARAIHAVGTADAEIDLSRLSLAEQRRELGGATVNAMLGTLTTERIAELDRTSLRAALERLHLTQTRLAYAHGTELDVDRAQQDVEAARALVVQADEAVRQAREDLGELVGSTTPTAAIGDLDIERFEQAIATTCQPTADVDHRADVAEARKRVDIAERAITDAKLRFAPTLGVSSQVSDANVSTLGPASNWTVSATITVPLYDGGSRYGALRVARAELVQAHDAWQQTRVAAIVDAARSERVIGVAAQSPRRREARARSLRAGRRAGS